MDETCPFCGHAAKFETKEAPAWFLRKGIAPQLVHVSAHEPCRDYWFAADGAAHTEAGHLPFMRALGAEEKQFYAETVRRLRDGDLAHFVSRRITRLLTKRGRCWGIGPEPA